MSLSSKKKALAPLDELNLKHAVVRDGGRTLVINEEHDPVLDRTLITRSSCEDFKRFYQNRSVPVGSNEEPKSVPLGAYWLKHPQRRQFTGIVFSPGKEIPGYYNLWKGFAVEPAPGDWSLMRDHIDRVICAGNADHRAWLLAWMARGVQRPAERAEVAVVLRGARGTGKGVWAQTYGGLFGSHFVHVSNNRHLTGHFNAHLQDAVVVFADEAFGTSDPQAEATLKMLITEARIPIERKGRDVGFAMNMVHLILASNGDWVIPAAFDERRFFLLDVSDRHLQDRRYFQALLDQMQGGGRAAMLYDLHHFDFSSIDLRDAPITAALREQQIHSLKPHERWWHEKLAHGRLLPSHARWERSILCGDLHDDYIHTLSTSGVRDRGTETELGAFLRKLLPEGGLVHRQRREKPSQLAGLGGSFSEGGKRHWHWEFPDLASCRAHFDKRLRSTTAWPPEAPTKAVTTVTTFPKQREGKAVDQGQIHEGSQLS